MAHLDKDDCDHLSGSPDISLVSLETARGKIIECYRCNRCMGVIHTRGQYLFNGSDKTPEPLRLALKRIATKES